MYSLWHLAHIQVLYVQALVWDWLNRDSALATISWSSVGDQYQQSVVNEEALGFVGVSVGWWGLTQIGV